MDKRFIGIALGLFTMICGACAKEWLAIAHAVTLIFSPFFGSLLISIVALTLLLSCVGAWFVLSCEDFRSDRLRVIGTFILLWVGVTLLTQWHLAQRWDLGTQSLRQAADLPVVNRAHERTIMRLWRGPQTIAQSRIHWEANSISLEPESLVRIEKYMDRRGYRSLWTAQALAALRQGPLLWWDTDKALETNSLYVPGWAHPDYLGALALISAGPLTRARYAALEHLTDIALAHHEGFENINQSQLIFEAFAAAYARFGEEERARFWLMRIANLVMVIEKAVKIPALEIPLQGRILGSVSAANVSALTVGLFHYSVSTGTFKETLQLSDRRIPQSDGSFEFSHLGQGDYVLALQGDSAVLAENSAQPLPGVITLSEKLSRVRLPKIVLGSSGAR